MSDSDIDIEPSAMAVKDVGQTISDTALLQVAKGSALLLLGTMLARVCGFLRQFIVIRQLSPRSYGLFALALTIVNLLVAFGMLGLYHGAQRFIAYNMAKEDLPRVKGTIRSSIWTVSAAGLVFMALTMVFSGTLSSFFAKPELKNLLLIMAPMVPLNIIAMIITAFFLGLHRTGPQILIDDVGFGLVSVIAIAAALLINKSLYSPAIAMLVSFFMVFVVSIIFYRRRWPLDLSGVRAFPITKQLLIFSLPLFFTDALYLVMGNMDTIVIAHFMSAAQLGYYNAAFLLMTVVPIFLTAVSIIYLPVATGLTAKKAHAESLRLYQSCTRWLFIFTLPIFLTFFLFPAQTLNLLFGSRYAAAGTALWILSLGAFINAFLGPNNYALIANAETRLVFMGTLVAAVIDIVLCVVLVPRIGISGAAIATACALGASNLMYSLLLWTKHKLHPFEKKYVITVLFMFAVGIALYKPMKMAISREHWLVLAVYPLFLLLGLLFIILTRSVTDEDRLLWRTIRDKFRR